MRDNLRKIFLRRLTDELDPIANSKRCCKLLKLLLHGPRAGQNADRRGLVLNDQRHGPEGLIRLFQLQQAADVEQGWLAERYAKPAEDLFGIAPFLSRAQVDALDIAGDRNDRRVSSSAVRNCPTEVVAIVAGDKVGPSQDEAADCRLQPMVGMSRGIARPPASR